MKRLIIIGASISGGMAACYLKLRFPDFDVVSIQKRNAKFPIVGESLTEFSTLLLHEIGLSQYLEERHFHKYGLTFYFKERIDDPTDYTYATHEATRIPPMPSNQLNRFTLARRLRERADELGVRSIEGTVNDVFTSESGPNQVAYADRDGNLAVLDTDWIIDASGRNRLLANKLGLKKRSQFQRSTFWFRLEGFDKRILKQMREVKNPHHCFDSYYVTHHFFGKNNWIWAIPMRPDCDSSHKDLISIGIVYRPDLYGQDITTVDDFMCKVGDEHPVITKLVRSGTIVDTNIFRHYFYETAQTYNARGWCIIGDAGDTVDPLYSTGIAMTSIQIKQVAAIIDAWRSGTLTASFVMDLEKVYKTMRDLIQFEISTLYEVMDDPFQSHMRVHLSSAFYFFVLLPAWLAGYITDRIGARILLKVLASGTAGFDSLKSLLAFASLRLGRIPATQIKNMYDQTVNWDLFAPSEQDIPHFLAKFCVFLARSRFFILRKAGWHDWLKHIPLCLADLCKALLFRVVIGRRAMKDLGVVKWMVRL